jgi:TetR/AcrR family transcriptional repressor of nem operon
MSEAGVSIPTRSGSETRAHLIRVGSEIIAYRGFNSTGINAVLKEAGVPKGSFYYYFASKEDFGLAVIEDFAGEYDQRLDRTLGNEALAPLDRIRQYMELGIMDMEACDHSRGCLIGNLGQELAGQNESFRVRVEGIFARWQHRFTVCLAEAQSAGVISKQADAALLAEFLLAGWQGATLRAKVNKSVAPMRHYAEVFFDQVLRAPE